MEIRVKCVGIAREAVMAVGARVASGAPMMGMGMASVGSEVKAVRRLVREGVASKQNVDTPARSVARLEQNVAKRTRSVGSGGDHVEFCASRGFCRKGPGHVAQRSFHA